MHNQTVYDTTTQAMTEVALGLSMAFFALLIVALLSLQMPNPDLPESSNKPPAAETSLRLKTQQTPRAANTATTQQIIFFYQGRFVSAQLQPLDLSALDQAAPVVLAVEQSLSFAEVMNIRQQINHPNLSITLINAQWQQLLEQQP